MNATAGLRTAVAMVVCSVLLSCTLAEAANPNFTQAATAPLPTLEAALPAGTSGPETMPSITGITWDADHHAIAIGVDPWPKSWSPWAMYVDGTEIQTGEQSGAIAVRPNAALSASPNGLIVGTLPWVSGLEKADFPCCGSLQFSIPGMGLTKAYDYNLHDEGCATASAKACPAEWTVHEGDWTIEAGKSETIENTKVIERGNIRIRNSAKLTIRNSELRMERGATPTIHVYIFVDPGGTLVVDSSKIYPGPGDGGLACVWNRGQATMTNSPTSIHYFDMGEGATFTMENSSMIYEIGGLLQVAGGTTHVTNSTLGALGLSVPAGGHLNATGLKAGAYFDHWTVQDLIPDARYELTFDKVTILEDFTGEYAHGPFERGWIFFLDPSSHVRLSDSEVRKIFIDLRGDTSEFQDLKIGQPASLKYRDIILENVAASGEWGFTITDATVAFRDSNYLFLQPTGTSHLNLVNSHMVEFIPRQFSGTITFENGEWTNAGEILGDVAYHSTSNNFRMAGSLKLGADLRTNLQWKDARVTREFEVLLTDSNGNPISQGVIKVGGQEYRTDDAGKTKFSIVFDDANYKVPTSLEAWYSGAPIARQQIDFFTESPIRLSP
jgi:hypothetical protein